MQLEGSFRNVILRTIGRNSASKRGHQAGTTHFSPFIHFPLVSAPAPPTMLGQSAVCSSLTPRARRKQSDVCCLRPSWIWAPRSLKHLPEPCASVRCTEPRDGQTGLDPSPASPPTGHALQANRFDSLTLSGCPSMGLTGGSDGKESAGNAWVIKTNAHRD
ncbi:unnamed protein product [Rangifer tarandus platyrhynchus]|uniref:Uncharacterized protein n=1 Tax=Rangifer tarandus platyrhynchus TaxID=3082113 RepID=A0AC59Z173_RANTA